MTASFLMCRPSFYGIEYEINPWMDVRRQADHPRALRQWHILRSTLAESIGAQVELVRARPSLPDMGFTANAGLVFRDTFIPSRFRYRERAGEEPFFTSWFHRRGYRVRPLPIGHHFEGEGDALFVGEKLFLGHFQRTDIRTHLLIGELLEVPVFSLEMVNPLFYHLDTAFMPFGPESALYYPKAFRLLRAPRAPTERARPPPREHRGGACLCVQRRLRRPPGRNGQTSGHQRPGEETRQSPRTPRDRGLPGRHVGVHQSGRGLQVPGVEIALG